MKYHFTEEMLSYNLNSSVLENILMLFVQTFKYLSSGIMEVELKIYGGQYPQSLFVQELNIFELDNIQIIFFSHLTVITSTSF